MHGFSYGDNLSTAVSSNGTVPETNHRAFMDDLSVNYTGGSVNYKLTGAAGSRVLTVEWKSMNWYWSAPNASISFQAKLYEGSNRIEFIYKQEAGAVANAVGASIGLGGLNTTDYYSLNNTGAAPTASKATNTTNLSTRPATGQIYRWTPSCTLPVDLLSFSGQTRGLKNILEWSTLSENKNDFFTIEKSTDGNDFLTWRISKVRGTARNYSNTAFGTINCQK